MAKLIVHAPTREQAIHKMITALNDYKILGVKTSKKFMIDCMNHTEFIEGRTYTSFIEQHMADRDLAIEYYRDIATAAAAVAATLKSAQPSVTGSAGAGVIPTPWLTIGNWRIGDNIHEQA